MYNEMFSLILTVQRINGLSIRSNENLLMLQFLIDFLYESHLMQLICTPTVSEIISVVANININLLKRRCLFKKKIETVVEDFC
jgi:hypothetical protein